MNFSMRIVLNHLKNDFLRIYHFCSNFNEKDLEKKKKFKP